MPSGKVEGDAVARFKKFFIVRESGCHEWQSTIQKDGYGRFYYKRRQIPAHRAAYLLFVGPIPKRMCVMHMCDNRRCVNLEHLRLGSYADNHSDMVSKNRHVGRRKLSNEQVMEIVSLLNAGELSQQAIADKIGISQITVSRIYHGQRKYLPHILNTHARTD